MSSNFDLDINNYSFDDLLNFFKLNQDYNINDIERKVGDMVNDILYTDTDLSHTKQKYKLDIVDFIKEAKVVLMSTYHDIQNEIEITKVKNLKKENNVGKIINPLAAHPALQRQTILNDDINPYRHNRNKSVYVFNTASRLNFFKTISTNCTFELPLKLKNVISISLASVQLPNVMLTFSSERQTNQLYIFEDYTNANTIIKIPDGNYSRINVTSPIVEAFTTFIPSMRETLEKEINTYFNTIGTPLDRFKVYIDPSTNKTTISNTTYTFSMNIVKKDPYDLNICNSYGQGNIDNIDEKEQIKPATFMATLGYLLGYRKVKYSGANSYTSEGTFNNKYSSYLYFTLDDHTGSQTITNTYGILQDSLIDENVLGLIPLDIAPFEILFDNNSNFIYKKRDYYGPVDISKISIKLLNQAGSIVNLLQDEFSFSLQVTSIYDVKKPFIIADNISDLI